MPPGMWRLDLSAHFLKSQLTPPVVGSLCASKRKAYQLLEPHLLGRCAWDLREKAWIKVGSVKFLANFNVQVIHFSWVIYMFVKLTRISCRLNKATKTSKNDICKEKFRPKQVSIKVLQSDFLRNHHILISNRASEPVNYTALNGRLFISDMTSGLQGIGQTSFSRLGTVKGKRVWWLWNLE